MAPQSSLQRRYKFLPLPSSLLEEKNLLRSCPSELRHAQTNNVPVPGIVNTLNVRLRERLRNGKGYKNFYWSETQE